MTERVSELITRWNAARAAVQAIERAEHPDATDKYGRVWIWISGDLYRHDQLAWPLAIITSEHFGLPGPGLADNPNYDLCAICTQDWPDRRPPPWPG